MLPNMNAYGLNKGISSILWKGKKIWILNLVICFPPTFEFSNYHSVEKRPLKSLHLISMRFSNQYSKIISMANLCQRHYLCLPPQFLPWQSPPGMFNMGWYNTSCSVHIKKGTGCSPYFIHYILTQRLSSIHRPQ